MYQQIIPQFIETYYKDWRSLEAYAQSGIYYQSEGLFFRL